VRELRRIVERASALAETDTITRRDLPDHVLGGGPRDATPGTPAPAVASPVAATTDLGLKAAKDRWMALLDTFHRLINKHHIRG
jgi:transcriptional regulator of acetoin/glycerol metabolism